MKKVVLLLLLAVMLTLPAAAENTSIVYFNDGSLVMIPAEIANDPAQLSEYCNTYFPGRGYSFDAAAGDYDAVLSEEWAVSQFGEGSRAMGVQLVKLGLTECTVKTAQGDEIVVPSRCLKFSDQTDADHLLGVVYAPRSGEASLRESEGGSAKVIKQAKSGRIVVILQYDAGNFTKISYDGVEGYIRTDCLIFFDGQVAPMGNGILHVKNKMDGSANVTVRADESTSAAKVAAWPAGMNVIVHSGNSKWYLVEYDGWCGHVQAQYLNVE